MTDQPTTPPPPPPSTGSTSTSGKGFFGRLFDLSFNEFVTPSLIKVIYVLGIIIAALVAVGIFASLADEGGGGVVLGLLLAPFVFFVYVIFARVLSEVYLILFRIEENTRRQR